MGLLVGTSTQLIYMGRSPVVVIHADIANTGNLVFSNVDASLTDDFEELTPGQTYEIDNLNGWIYGKASTGVVNIRFPWSKGVTEVTKQP